MLEAVLAPILAPGRPIALANFPNQNNPGDNAIWLGTKASLRRLGVPVGYACSSRTFDAAAMRAAVGDGPLVLGGGGNFGDVYRGQQDLREQVLERCTDRPVVQLPQSIWFRDPANAQRLGRLCRSHPHFTLIVRERASMQFARDVFGLEPLFAPDMALALGPLRSRVAPEIPILWLGRYDPERLERPAPPPDIPLVDWVRAPDDDRFSATDAALLAENHRRTLQAAAGDAIAGEAAASTFDGLARAWLARGLDILGSAHVVITDRLHAHELATLLGKPHVVLDNANGKVRGVFDAWTGASGLGHWAETTDEAVEIARRLCALRSADPATAG
jgi:pyruvyl transferase EpsO